MGGVAIVAGIWAGYLGTHLVGIALDGEGPSASGLLVLGLATALGVVGFVDDLIKIRTLAQPRPEQDRQDGRPCSSPRCSSACWSLQFRNADGLTPGSAELSYVREIATVTLAPAVFVLFCVRDRQRLVERGELHRRARRAGRGCMAMVSAAYVIITFWQFRNACATAPGWAATTCATRWTWRSIAAATAGACIGFLWWNAAPAKIFMGDTGSLALGGIIAGLSVTSRTEMLAVVLGALFVAEITSVVVQILAFRTTGRRVFRMAPFHHHFELVGWAETTVIIRFWLLTAIACGLGVALFYGEWLATVGA